LNRRHYDTPPIIIRGHTIRPRILSSANDKSAAINQQRSLENTRPAVDCLQSPAPLARFDQGICQVRLDGGCHDSIISDPLEGRMTAFQQATPTFRRLCPEAGVGIMLYRPNEATRFGLAPALSHPSVKFDAPRRAGLRRRGSWVSNHGGVAYQFTINASVN
jgi:hypothetical protein